MVPDARRIHSLLFSALVRWSTVVAFAAVPASAAAGYCDEVLAQIERLYGRIAVSMTVDGELRIPYNHTAFKYWRSRVHHVPDSAFALYFMTPEQRMEWVSLRTRQEVLAMPRVAKARGAVSATPLQALSFDHERMWRLAESAPVREEIAAVGDQARTGPMHFLTIRVGEQAFEILHFTEMGHFEARIELMDRNPELEYGKENPQMAIVGGGYIQLEFARSAGATDPSIRTIKLQQAVVPVTSATREAEADDTVRALSGLPRESFPASPATIIEIVDRHAGIVRRESWEDAARRLGLGVRPTD
jgi:hypothetical protein